MVVAHSRIQQVLFVTMWVLPLLVILTTYIAIAAYTENIWPWYEVVHESGQRTLIGTVFYFQHAARELPLDILLGVAIGGSALWAFPRGGSTRRGMSGMLIACLLIVIGVIVTGTLWTGGTEVLWNNLLQMHTRPGEALIFGGHWRYHFLSRLILMLVSFGLAGFMVLLLRGKQGAGGKTGQSVFIGALSVYLTLSLVFIPSLEPFLDPIFLGHQIREVLTHGLITVPLGWWACLLLSGDDGRSFEHASFSVSWSLLIGASGVLTGLFLLIGGLATSAASMAQTDNFTLLIGPHFFEHTFSYLLVLLVAGLTYEMQHD